MTSFVHVGPTRVRVRITGDGPPLLMIMGIGGNLDMWQPLAARLTGRQLIMFDFPGTGASAASFLPPTMGANALFTRSLLHALGYDRVDVLGYSWGGVLAQHLALQHRRSVGRLVLAATTVGLGGVPPSLQVASRMLTPRRYYSREYFQKVAAQVYGGRFRHDAELTNAEASRRIAHPPGLTGYAAQLLALLGYSTAPGLPFIAAQTLVLGGDDDPIVPTANQRILASLIRDSELKILPGAGHLFLFDSSDVAAPLINRFLEGCETMSECESSG
jgi:pimeloyl-ACP methyl ester carboxylesterase